MAFTKHLEELIEEENWDKLTQAIVGATDDPFVDVSLLYLTVMKLRNTAFPRKTLDRLQGFVDAIPD